MNTKKPFSRITSFTGRNGIGKCSGIDLLKVGNDILIAPLTGNGSVANCEICVPQEDVESLIEVVGLAAGRQTCAFVPASSLVPKAWSEWFWTLISENAPFSWGNNNRSLVTASDFARHCEDRLEGTTSQSSITRFLKKVRALGETYIDLEN